MRSSGEPRERLEQFAAQRCIIAFNTTGASDENMVGPSCTVCWQQVARERTKPALHSVAYHRAAYFFCDSVSHTHFGIAIVAGANKQDKSWHRRALTGVRGKEVCAFGKGN